MSINGTPFSCSTIDCCACPNCISLPIKRAIHKIILTFNILKTGYELLARTKSVNENAEQFSAPVLMLQGQADKVVRPEISKLFFDQLAVKDKTWHSYAGMYHELLNDTGKERVIDDIMKWMERRIG